MQVSVRVGQAVDVVGQVKTEVTTLWKSLFKSKTLKFSKMKRDMSKEVAFRGWNVSASALFISAIIRTGMHSASLVTCQRKGVNLRVIYFQNFKVKKCVNMKKHVDRVRFVCVINSASTQANEPDPFILFFLSWFSKMTFWVSFFSLLSHQGDWVFLFCFSVRSELKILDVLLT